MIDPTAIAELDAAGLRALARDYQRTAKQLLLKASELEVRSAMQARVQTQFELLKQLPGKVRDRMRAGLTEDQAIEAVAAGQCCPMLTVKVWCEIFLSQQREEHRMARDARIL